MKILCLSRAPLDFKGGIPSYCLNLYKNCKFDLKVFSYDIEKKINKKSTRLIKNIKETVYPTAFTYGTFAISFKYLLGVIKESFRSEIIHVQHPDPYSSLVIIILKIINWKCKIIVTWHADIYKNYKIFSPLLLILDFLLFILCEKIIFFTPFHLKSSIFPNFPFIKGKAEIINYCIECPSIDVKKIILKRNISITRKKNVDILSIGRLVSYKGYEYAIKAIGDTNKNVRYFIIGGGVLENELKNLIKNLNLSKRVFLLGNLTDELKLKYLFNSDIFLFPSVNQSEAFGISQLEALSFGLPIINTFLNNGVNYLVPKDIAITCKHSNSDEISQAINQITSKDELYKSISLKSISHFEKFSYQQMLENFNNLIQNI